MADVTTAESPAASTLPADSIHPKPPRATSIPLIDEAFLAAGPDGLADACAIYAAGRSEPECGFSSGG